MADIRFEPWGLTAKGEEGDSLLDVALEFNIPLPHACGGDAVCSTCAVRVTQGDQWLSNIEEDERETLDKLLPGHDIRTRLACQAQLRAGTDEMRMTVISLEEEPLTPA